MPAELSPLGESDSTDLSPLGGPPPGSEPDPVPALPPSRSLAQRIFLGADGLRAGWSLLLFFLLVFLLFAPARQLLSYENAKQHASAPSAASSAPHERAAPMAILEDGVLFTVVLLASVVMSRIERRPLASYGIGLTPRAPRQLLVGLLWGLLLLSVLVLILRLTHLLVFDARLLSGPAIPRFGGEWGIAFLLVGLFEEYLFRGFILFTLARGLSGIFAAILKTPRHDALGFWTSAVLLATLFGLVHRSNPGESSIGLLTAALAALVFSFSLWRTGSLWWAIGFHASWDWAQSFLYGVADSGGLMQHRFFATHPVGQPLLSGGLTGPEGSIFALPVLAAIGVVIWITLPPARRPVSVAQISPRTN